MRKLDAEVEFKDPQPKIFMFKVYTIEGKHFKHIWGIYSTYDKAAEAYRDLNNPDLVIKETGVQ